MAGRLEQRVCLLGEPGVPFLDGPVESFGAARLAQAVQDRPDPGQWVAGLAEHADDGWDTASDLDRPGVFRLNIAVGRTAFEKLTGYPPGEHDAQSVRLDYTTLDRLIPHPAYAAQAWVAILNPGEATAHQARSLLTDAHALAARRHDRRRG